MASRCDPVVGDWYRSLAGDLFEVVAVDDQEATVGIQYYSGEIEELDRDTWYELDLMRAEAPEDPSGAYDDVEPDEFQDSGGFDSPGSWDDVLDHLDREF